jgi:hypothetical protein
MTRRRVTTAAIGLAAVLGLGLGACAQDNTPTEYNTLTQQNFLEGCTNHYFDNTDDTIDITGNTIAADVTAPDEGTCRCMYDVFVNTMSIDDFTTFNKDLKEDPQKAWDGLSQDVKDDLDACSSGTTGTTVAGGTTDTTAPAGAGDSTTTSSGA